MRRYLLPVALMLALGALGALALGGVAIFPWN